MCSTKKIGLFYIWLTVVQASQPCGSTGSEPTRTGPRRKQSINRPPTARRTNSSNRSSGTLRNVGTSDGPSKVVQPADRINQPAAALPGRLPTTNPFSQDAPNRSSAVHNGQDRRRRGSTNSSRSGTEDRGTVPTGQSEQYGGNNFPTNPQNNPVYVPGNRDYTAPPPAYYNPYNGYERERVTYVSPVPLEPMTYEQQDPDQSSTARQTCLTCNTPLCANCKSCLGCTASACSSFVNGVVDCVNCRGDVYESCKAITLCLLCAAALGGIGYGSYKLNQKFPTHRHHWKRD